MSIRLNCTAALLALLVAVPTSSVMAQDTRVTFSVGSQSMFYMMPHIAKGAGFYSEEGLDVELLSIQSGTQQVAAVIGGSALAGQFGVPHIVNASEGAGIVAVGPGYDIYPMALVLSNDALTRNGIAEDISVDEIMEKLDGLTIGITGPGSSTDQFIRTLFMTRGMNADSHVTLQPLRPGAPMLAALQQGAIDGFIGSSPFIHMAETSGAAKIVIDPLEGNVPEFYGLPYQFVATRQSALESDRAAIKGILRAHAKAMNLVAERPDEAREILRAAYSSMSDEDFDPAWESGVRGMPTTPVIEPEQFETAVRMINLTEPAPVSVTFEQVVNNSLGEEIAAELDASE